MTTTETDRDEKLRVPGEAGGRVVQERDGFMALRRYNLLIKWRGGRMASKEGEKPKNEGWARARARARSDNLLRSAHRFGN